MKWRRMKRRMSNEEARGIIASASARSSRTRRGSSGEEKEEREKEGR